MMVLCILLAMLSLFLSLKLIYQRKLVQKVKKQIDFLIDRDTQTEIMVEKTVKQMRNIFLLNTARRIFNGYDRLSFFYRCGDLIISLPVNKCIINHI